MINPDRTRLNLSRLEFYISHLFHLLQIYAFHAFLLFSFLLIFHPSLFFLLIFLSTLIYVSFLLLVLHFLPPRFLSLFHLLTLSLSLEFLLFLHLFFLLILFLLVLSFFLLLWKDRAYLTLYTTHFRLWGVGELMYAKVCMWSADVNVITNTGSCWYIKTVSWLRVWALERTLSENLSYKTGMALLLQTFIKFLSLLSHCSPYWSIARDIPWCWKWKFIRYQILTLCTQHVLHVGADHLWC